MLSRVFSVLQHLFQFVFGKLGKIGKNITMNVMFECSNGKAMDLMDLESTNDFFPELSQFVLPNEGCCDCLDQHGCRKSNLSIARPEDWSSSCLDQYQRISCRRNLVFSWIPMEKPKGIFQSTIYAQSMWYAWTISIDHIFLISLASTRPVFSHNIC